MRVIRAVSLDLEGPIFDFESLHFLAFMQAIKALFGLEVSKEWIFENVPNAIGGGDPLIAKSVANHYDRGSEWEKLLAVKNECFGELLRENSIHPRAGALDAIRWFREAEYALAIGSLTPRASAMRYIESAGLTELIEEGRIVLAEDVRDKKPHPDVYIETARRLGVEPRMQLVIDDSVPGLQAASAAGSPSIATPLHRFRDHMIGIAMAAPRRVIWGWHEVNLPLLMANLEHELAM